MIAEDTTWGPTLRGGRGRMRRWILVAAALTAAAAVALVAVGVSLYQVAEGNIGRVDLPALAPKEQDPSKPLNILVVGSDSREGLTQEETRRLRLGEFDGQRGDTVLLVSITPDHEVVSVVSFPRDLRVKDDGVRRKLTDTFVDGPDHTLEVLQELTGVPIHHYVEISIPGFLNIVDVLGWVEICLEEPLRDRKSGANFTAGCHRMGPAESLAYVRSRSTRLGDFDRMERQQTFIRAAIDRVLSAGILMDLPRLFSLVDSVSRHVTTDADLGPAEKRVLARELRHLARGDIPMTTLPSYASTVDGIDYVIAYQPGVQALYEALREGRPLEPRGPTSGRRETTVAFWNAGDMVATSRAQRTLQWAAFRVTDAVRSPVETEEKVVFELPGHAEQARWVAAVLGAPVVAFPDDRDPPAHAQVVVAVTPERTGAGEADDDDAP
jgi:LCP family protein required for cell wall assembly